jgi:uncharacterized protein YcbX
MTDGFAGGRVSSCTSTRSACGGTDLGVAEIGPRGVAADRLFALVGPDHEVITQREHPVLATVRPSYAHGC